MAKSYAVLIDILKRLPDSPTASISGMEKEGAEGADFSGSAKGEQIIKDEILPQLEKLMGDEDTDVQYFASAAKKAWTESAMET